MGLRLVEGSNRHADCRRHLGSRSVRLSSTAHADRPSSDIRQVEGAVGEDGVLILQNGSRRREDPGCVDSVRRAGAEPAIRDVDDVDEGVVARQIRGLPGSQGVHADGPAGIDCARYVLPELLFVFHLVKIAARCRAAQGAYADSASERRWPAREHIARNDEPDHERDDCPEVGVGEPVA